MTMNGNNNGNNNGAINGDGLPVPNGDTRSNTPPLQADKVLEVDALEELLRQETLRHIEAAWKAQRRLMQACIAPPSVKVLMPSPDQDMADVEEPSPKETEEAAEVPPVMGVAEEEAPSIAAGEETKFIEATV